MGSSRPQNYILGVGVALFLAAGLVVPSSSAYACKCVPSSVASAYQDVDAVFVGTIVFKITVANEVWHVARVRGVFGGCAEKNQWVLIRTNSSSAACGANLDEGATYLLFGDDVPTNWSVPLYQVTSCDPNQKVSELSASERDWLMGRTVCCDQTCDCVGNQAMFNCFVDPCMFAQCPSGDCQANYCGGCNAEFYTDQGHAVCTPCSTDSDCGGFLHCFVQSDGAGICVPQCATDDDCNDGYWCGFLNQDDDKVCKPYQQEGDYCGGYTPIWAVTKCMPGLSCTDTSAFIPDMPGRCRKPCQGDKDCGDEQYCSSNQFCRDLGACFTVADCELSTNDYIKDDCEGYATCQNGACGWACGYSPCTDLSGVEFGACEMFMGWGVVDGKCTGVSGCGAMGYTFFQSEIECQSECGGFGEGPWK